MMPPNEALSRIAELRRRNRSEYLTKAECDPLLDIAEKAIAVADAFDGTPNVPIEVELAALKQLRAAIKRLTEGQ